MNTFKIIVPVYNAQEWIINNLNIIHSQTHKHFECVIIDDMSTDKTVEYIQKYLSMINDDRFKLLVNTEKAYALKNIYNGIKYGGVSFCDIIVIVDGDDWLVNDRVLEFLDKFYTEKECWLTYGSFVVYPHAYKGREASPYPNEIIDNNLYRKDSWRASHLKTFKYQLWNKVEEKDLQDKNGEFYECAYDQAMMLPMLEMAGHRAEYVDEILYVYNVTNPQAVNQTRVNKQTEIMVEVRHKEPYSRIDIHSEGLLKTSKSFVDIEDTKQGNSK